MSQMGKGVIKVGTANIKNKPKELSCHYIKDKRFSIHWRNWPVYQLSTLYLALWLLHSMVWFGIESIETSDIIQRKKELGRNGIKIKVHLKKLNTELYWRHKVSISSTFYAQIFVQTLFWQLFLCTCN